MLYFAGSNYEPFSAADFGFSLGFVLTSVVLAFLAYKHLQWETGGFAKTLALPPFDCAAGTFNM